MKKSYLFIYLLTNLEHSIAMLYIYPTGEACISNAEEYLCDLYDLTPFVYMQLHCVFAPTYRGLRKEKNTTDEAFFFAFKYIVRFTFFLFFL